MVKSARSEFVEAVYFQSYPGIEQRMNAKKAAILIEAIRFISTNGVTDLNIGTLAKRLKMSRSNLQYYFKDLSELLEGVVRLVAATAQRITIDRVHAKMGNPSQTILAIADGGFEWAKQYPAQLTCMMMFFFYTGFDSKLRRISNQIRNVGLERLTQLLASAQPSAPPGELESKALQLQSVITGFLIASKIHSDAGGIERFQQECLETCRTLIKG